jgi:hypothetical protein
VPANTACAFVLNANRERSPFRASAALPSKKMNFVSRALTSWQLRNRALSLGARTLVMGVVNITPDSFSNGGSFLSPEAAVAHALRLIDDGADILDLGAESTRPGSHAGGQAGSAGEPAVSADEEQARLLPVLEGILKERPHAVVSIDTYKAATARAAINTGAEIINDVSGFLWDPALTTVCAESKPGVVLMHTRPPIGGDPSGSLPRSRSGDRARRPGSPPAEIRNTATRFCLIRATGRQRFGENTRPARAPGTPALVRPPLLGCFAEILPRPHSRSALQRIGRSRRGSRDCQRGRDGCRHPQRGIGCARPRRTPRRRSGAHRRRSSRR